MKPRVFCSVVTKDHIPSARTLLASLRQENPHEPFVVLVVDWPRAGGHSVEGVTRMLVPSDVMELKDFERLGTYYKSFELCNALRPKLLLHLLRRFQKVIYLDTDVWVTGSFRAIWKGLNRYSFGFTPHITKPYASAYSRPSELSIVQYGTYNSGFLAFRNDRASIEALSFLDERWRRFAFYEPPVFHAGQEFLDLLPVFHRERFWSISDPGYNIAFWNLHERELHSKKGTLYVNRSPAIFFHLSGYDWQVPDRFTRYGCDYSFVSHPLLREVTDAYRASLIRFSRPKLPMQAGGVVESPDAKARRRYQFIHGSLKGYSQSKGGNLADTHFFNEVLKNRMTLAALVLGEAPR